MFAQMKTTIQIKDSLWNELLKRKTTTGASLRWIIEKALTAFLAVAEESEAKGKKR